MKKNQTVRLAMLLLVSAFSCFSFCAQVMAQSSDADRLVKAMLEETPLHRDLQQLCDEIGGRPTGSEANVQSVDWCLQKFKEAGVSARKEAFKMPGLWLEKSCQASITGDISFAPSVTAMTFSAAAQNLTAPLVDGGQGSESDFAALGKRAKDAFVLVETEELLDVNGLFKEYADAVGTEQRAFAAGATGVVYMSSRPKGLLYRHNASRGYSNQHPMLVMEREDAKRALRLIRSGKKLDLTATIDVETGDEYDSYNVIGEIPGDEKPDEYVVIGAHLDSWGMGTGANDNGCNVTMLIDIARQMQALGIRPKRTIRFALWNGEELGFFGSWDYTRRHAREMDNHIMACSIDIGSGQITGFFTNGREELIQAVDEALQPVSAQGPFQHINMPIVGTDNYDFMMQGVANLVGNHDPYNYGPNYHAESDTYDKVDLQQLRKNAAIVAALAYGFATMEVDWKRHTRSEVQNLIDTTSLRDQMDMFGLYPGWVDGSRGRAAQSVSK